MPSSLERSICCRKFCFPFPRYAGNKDVFMVVGEGDCWTCCLSDTSSMGGMVGVMELKHCLPMTWPVRMASAQDVTDWDLCLTFDTAFAHIRCFGLGFAMLLKVEDKVAY